MPVFAKLNPRWLLRGWADYPYTVVDWTKADIRLLDAKGFYVAESCDGQTDFDSLAFLPQHRIFLQKLISEGIAEECSRGSVPAHFQNYRKAQNPRINGMHWAITGLCNLSCRHCCMEAPSGKYGEPPYQDLLHIMDELERANVLKVSLTGGEPLLRADFPDILRELYSRRIMLDQICTNGLLITDELLDQIKQIGFHPHFQISFDGVGMHHAMRGVDGIESDTVQAIQRTLSAGFRVTVSTSIDKATIRSLDATYHLMKKIGVHYWMITPPLASGNWKHERALPLSLNEMSENLLPLMKQWLEDGKPIPVKFFAFWDGKAGDATNDDEIYAPLDFDCAGCREYPALLPNGTLVPCQTYAGTPLEKDMPNLMTENLSEVWTRSRLRSILDLRKKDILASNPECTSCEFLSSCGMGCRAAALIATGNIMEREPLTCKFWKNGHRAPFAAIEASHNNL